MNIFAYELLYLFLNHLKFLPTLCEHFVFKIIIFIKYLYYNILFFGFIKHIKRIIKHIVSYL